MLLPSKALPGPLVVNYGSVSCSKTFWHCHKSRGMNLQVGRWPLDYWIMLPHTTGSVRGTAKSKKADNHKIALSVIVNSIKNKQTNKNEKLCSPHPKCSLYFSHKPVVKKSCGFNVTCDPLDICLTWCHKWRGGCVQHCPWAAAKWHWCSGRGRRTAEKDCECHWMEAEVQELGEAAKARCCPPLVRWTDRKESKREHTVLYIFHFLWLVNLLCFIRGAKESQCKVYKCTFSL